MGKSPNEVGRYNTDAGSDHCNHPALLDARAKCFCLVKDPEKIFLPKANLSTTYVFAGESDFFAYPNNYNYYVSYYRNTFQHGGISMNEMLIPVTHLTAK